MRKGINRLRKEINCLFSKGMSNICLKVTMRKTDDQTFIFLSLKNLSPGRFLGSFNSRRYHGICPQFVIFKPLSYCFEETIGFDVKASFASRPVLRLIRWYNQRILRKDYRVPRNFSWIENYKLFLLQIKTHMSGSKTVCGFSILLILKGIITFLKS